MSTNFNMNNIQSMMNTTRSAVTSWLSSNGGSASLGGFDPNSIFDLLNQGQAAIDCGNAQRAQAITNMAQNLLSMIMSLGNQSTKARQEVKTQEKQSNDLNNKAVSEDINTNTELTDIMSQVTNNTLTINNALAKLEELGGQDGESGKVKYIQDRLKAYLDKIDEEKEKINNSVTSTDEKKAALDRIKNYAEQISALVSEVIALQNEIIEQNSIVEESAGNVENLFSNASEIAEEGVSTQQSNIASGAAQITKNSAISVEGGADETVGAELTASSWVPVVGTQASRKGADLITAGGIRIAGAANNISSISSTLGSVNGSLNNITQNFGQIGSLVNDFGGLVGQYGSQLEALITSTGSLGNISEAYAQLDAAIKDADGKLNGNLFTPVWRSNGDSSNSSLPFLNPTNKTQSENEDNSSENKDNLIFKYERKVFGI